MTTYLCLFRHTNSIVTQAERVDLAHETDGLKAQFAAVTHETQELHKKDIVAAEAVSQVQARLVQQKEEIAANERKYVREVVMRHKWAREKAKFEKYYNDQVRVCWCGNVLLELPRPPRWNLCTR